MLRIFFTVLRTSVYLPSKVFVYFPHFGKSYNGILLRYRNESDTPNNELFRKLAKKNSVYKTLKQNQKKKSKTNL